MLRYFPLPPLAKPTAKRQNVPETPVSSSLFRSSFSSFSVAAHRPSHLFATVLKSEFYNYRLITPTAQRDVALNATDIYSVRNVAYFSLSLSLSFSPFFLLSLCVKCTSVNVLVYTKFFSFFNAQSFKIIKNNESFVSFQINAQNNPR